MTNRSLAAFDSTILVHNQRLSLFLNPNISLWMCNCSCPGAAGLKQEAEMIQQHDKTNRTFLKWHVADRTAQFVLSAKPKLKQIKLYSLYLMISDSPIPAVTCTFALLWPEHLGEQMGRSVFLTHHFRDNCLNYYLLSLSYYCRFLFPPQRKNNHLNIPDLRVCVCVCNSWVFMTISTLTFDPF